MQPQPRWLNRIIWLLIISLAGAMIYFFWENLEQKTSSGQTTPGLSWFNRRLNTVGTEQKPADKPSLPSQQPDQVPVEQPGQHLD